MDADSISWEERACVAGGGGMAVDGTGGGALGGRLLGRSPTSTMVTSAGALLNGETEEDSCMLVGEDISLDDAVLTAIGA